MKSSKEPNVFGSQKFTVNSTTQLHVLQMLKSVSEFENNLAFLHNLGLSQLGSCEDEGRYDHQTAKGLIHHWKSIG